MSLYIGYYYGVFLDSSRILSAEEIDCFYNGDDNELLEDLEEKKIQLVSSENEPVFILGKQINKDSFYDVFYSGLVKEFDIDKFKDFNKEEASNAIISQINNLNEILKKHNRQLINLTEKDFIFFTHTIS